MKQKQSTPWLQKRLCFTMASAAVGAVVAADPTVAVLGISAVDAPISNPQAVAQKPDAIATKLVTVYRSPSCGCCGGWIDYMKKQGFQTKDLLISEMGAVKQKYKVPGKLTSCHTAIVDGYVIEGHVPASDIKRLLKEKPNVAGISVPQMPVGAPGMEAGDRRDPFTVFSFDKKGKPKVFNKYPSS